MLKMCSGWMKCKLQISNLIKTSKITFNQDLSNFSTMKKDKLLEIINKGFLEWNKYKGNVGDSTIDLSGIDLSYKDLRKIDFSNCLLKKANLQRCHLGDTNFQSSSATLINLNHAYLIQLILKTQI